MELKLNKLISDSGLCSRREADKFIEMGRVTVNGKLPEIGAKVNDTDIVIVDDARIRVGVSTEKEFIRAAPGKARNLVFGNREHKPSSHKKVSRPSTAPSGGTRTTEDGSKAEKPLKYGKYNKYAAARKAAKATGESEKPKTGTKARTSLNDIKSLKDAMKPQFGKSLSKGAVAQRLAAAPKSASLRKTSKNNPINKAKRAAARNKPKDE